jgi:2,3-bisphosphoglycerate-independent phosphoglycerate mutase
VKYIVFLCDGMSDYKLKELNDKTPLEEAKKINMNSLAKQNNNN